MKRFFTYLLALAALTSCVNDKNPLPSNLEIMEPEGLESSLSVVFKGKVEGGIGDAECGFYLSEDENFATSEKVNAEVAGSGDGTFAITKVLRDYDGTWYCKAYWSNGNEEILSSAVSYVVKPFASYVNVTDPTIVSSADGRAVFEYSVTAAEGVALTECGLCYGTSADALSVDSDHIVSSTITGFHSEEVDGLAAGQTYYVCSYAREDEHIVYSASCPLAIAAAPLINTSEPSGVEATGAVCGGCDIVANGSAITDKGIAWSMDHNPEISTSSYLSAGSGTDAFTCTISGLSPVTTYYVRAYAQNDVGIVYGQEMAFTTKPINVAGVSLDKTSLTMTEGDSQTLIATITPSDATDKSVIWSSSSDSVAAVDANGTVTAIGAGSATITVRTDDGGCVAECDVTVNAKVYPVKGVTLNKSSLTMAAGDSQTLTATIFPANATNKNVTWASSNTSVATVDADGKVTCLSDGKAVITVKTDEGGYTALCNVKTVPDGAVDLGLSVFWATCNLGASQPEQAGGYYQWGGLQDATDSSLYLDYSYCPHHTGSSGESGWIKYVPSDGKSFWSGSGSPDNKTTLDPEDDAVRKELGDRWRMPTKSDWSELNKNCTSEWTTVNGVKGRKFTSKKNGNSIFLPAAGFRRYRSINDAGCAYYWSSSLYLSNCGAAHGFLFNSSNSYVDYSGRYLGRSIRPVAE